MIAELDEVLICVALDEVASSLFMDDLESVIDVPVDPCLPEYAAALHAAAKGHNKG